MNNIKSIAKNTFKETIRDRILYGIVAFALLFILSTTIFGSLSLGEDIKVIKDFGLAGIYLFGVIIAIFLGTSLIYKEIEKRTIYILLSKPVRSGEIVVGKFLGLFLSILLTVTLMTVVYLIVVAAKGGGFDLYSLLAILLELIEIAVFISLSILFSTFTTPLAAAIYSTLILYIGHSLNLLIKFAHKSGTIAEYFAYPVYYLLPNLEKFNIRNLVVYGSGVSATEISLAIIYGLLYSAILLFLADLSLKRQEY